jgi:hypothetical protein
MSFSQCYDLGAFLRNDSVADTNSSNDETFDWDLGNDSVTDTTPGNDEAFNLTTMSFSIPEYFNLGDQVDDSLLRNDSVTDTNSGNTNLLDDSLLQNDSVPTARAYSCTYCVCSGFNTLTELKRHKKNVHGKRMSIGEWGSAELICQVCNKKFLRPNDLVRHEDNAHKNAKTFCELCNAGFACQKTLQTHLSKDCIYRK